MIPFITGSNFCTSSGLLTATGGETVHDTTVTITFCINGKAYTKTAITDGATPTTDHVTGAAFVGLVGTASGGGQGCAFVWCLNSSGSVKVIQGPVIALNSSGDFAPVGAPQFPQIPSDVVPFAYMVSKHYGQGSTFTFGSSNWNISGYSHAIQNILVLPNRPQAS